MDTQTKEKRCCLRPTQAERLSENVHRQFPKLRRLGNASNISRLFSKNKIETMTSTSGRIWYYFKSKVMFFEEDNELYPTLNFLWNYPTIMRSIEVSEEASEYILKGADLMLGGIVSLVLNIKPGEKIALHVTGNEVPFAVGYSVVSGEQISTALKSDAHGSNIVVFKNMHFYRDQFWDRYIYSSLKSDLLLPGFFPDRITSRDNADVALKNCQNTTPSTFYALTENQSTSKFSPSVSSSMFTLNRVQKPLNCLELDESVTSDSDTSISNMRSPNSTCNLNLHRTPHSRYEGQGQKHIARHHIQDIKEDDIFERVIVLEKQLLARQSDISIIFIINTLYCY